MRKRLYDRGAQAEGTVRHELTDTKIEVSRNWSTPAAADKRNVTDLRESMPTTSESQPVTQEKPKRHYRGFVLSGSLLIFIFVAVLSSLYMYFGGNQISSDNVKISIQGQSFVGGGETLSLQVAVTNQNTVPVESATLILRYPNGTRSVGDSPRNLFEERISLDDIAPGEVQNIPIQVAVFGEENAEKNIQATIEYRVEGSSARLYKDADPLSFRISSSPLVLRIESIEKVASGQLADITITAVSNASTPLEDILITAAYPNGFNFERSDPAPVYGENVWRIDELKPEQSTTIKLQGVVSGLTDETFRINFSAGPTSPDNQYIVSSALADSWVDFTIERPFIGVQISIDGDTDRSAILPEGKSSKVKVDVENTLDETVYDMVVVVIPGGNALEEDSIVSSSGFYDSNTGTVRWEVSNNPSFDRILPGDERSLEFEIEQGPVRTAASFDLVVNVYARRVAETSAQETLIGTVRAEAKYSSNINLAAQAGRNNAGFVDRGPIPPQVGQETTYTITLAAEAGANDLVNSIVETSLPVHVDWLDLYDAEGTVTYNSVSKKLQWEIGNIPAGTDKKLSFQVSIRPSISQLSSSPVLVNSQSMRANDRFSGALLQSMSGAVKTELSTEMGFSKDNGIVIK